MTRPMTAPIIVFLAASARSLLVAAMMTLAMIIVTATRARIPRIHWRMLMTVVFRSAPPRPSWLPTDSTLNVVAKAFTETGRKKET